MIDALFLYNCLVAVASIVGAHLASSKYERDRFYGYLTWLFSNGCIGVGFYLQGNYPLLLTFAVYELYNIRGIYNNWGRKKE